MQRLGATKHRRHRLNRRAHDVVVGILLGQRPARRLAVGAQHAAFGIGRPKGIDDFCPQQSRRAHLGNFHIEIHADAPEKTQPGRKIINLEASSNCGLDVLLTIGEGVGELKRCVRPRFLHVITRDRDRVELG